MATTSTVGGPCPRCEYDRCHIRYGTGTWYSFIACPDCGFGYGEHADTMDETHGIVTGIDVFNSLMEATGCGSLSELKEMSEELGEDIVEENTVFNFDDEDEHVLDLCVVSEEVVRMYGEAMHNGIQLHPDTAQT